MKHIRRIDRLFLGVVVLPIVISVVYFGIITSDVYISESRFVVRSPDRQSPSEFGGFLKGVGFSRSQDDSFTVQDFILSRDAVATLDDELDLKRAFGDSSVDVISRFPGLDWDDSDENFHRYYQKMVGVQLDSTSSISTLTTRAFTAEDAFHMNRRLLELSESLINQLNERGRADMIRFAANEVAESEKRAKATAYALARYRNEKGVIDPEKQSTIPLTQVAKLQDELIATKTQIAQLEKTAKENPQLPLLRQKYSLLEYEIQAERTRIAGAGDNSLAGKAAEYQQFVLEKEIADKMLASAMSTLEDARNEAQRKQLYLERIVQPSKPDKAMEPKRLRSILAVFVLGIVFWGVLTMLIAGIREHQD
jgi:capsular polysaccharide transport system permease protein